MSSLGNETDVYVDVVTRMDGDARLAREGEPPMWWDISVGGKLTLDLIVSGREGKPPGTQARLNRHPCIIRPFLVRLKHTIKYHFSASEGK